MYWYTLIYKLLYLCTRKICETKRWIAIYNCVCVYRLFFFGKMRAQFYSLQMFAPQPNLILVNVCNTMWKTFPYTRNTHTHTRNNNNNHQKIRDENVFPSLLYVYVRTLSHLFSHSFKNFSFLVYKMLANAGR